jgi:hypothetical protein
VGKSTLVERIAAHDHPAQVFTLDDQVTRAAASADPTGFVSGMFEDRLAAVPLSGLWA